MAAAQPWTPDETTTLTALHAAGHTLGEVARTMHRGPATISRRAKDLGLTWDRAQTAAAVKALVVDNRARRAQLEQDLLEDAAKLRAQLWEPALVFNFGGKDNTYEERTVDKPPFADQLKIVQAAGAAIDRSLKIAVHDSGVGTDDAKSLLGDLAKAFGVHDGG